ncbi:MAG: 1,4-beta-xylanase [Bacteroidota bacterium]
MFVSLFLKRQFLPSLLLWAWLISYSYAQEAERPLAKFEPPVGTCLFFVGQDLGATGGLDEYTDGYCDHFQTPAGVTVYSNLSPGGESFGYYNKGLDGLTNKASWGAGDCWAQAYLDDSTYQHTVMAIGLSLVNHEKRIAKGEHDDLIKELGEWIKSSNRPIFLRIGYEFDGWSWNHYHKKSYLKAWERIHSIFEEMKVENVALVWQSKGTGSGQEILEDWYPGDEIVDWCGYSYFGNPDEEMLTFARKHQKPVFIAEATPVRQIDDLYFDTDLKKDEIAQRVWREWFDPFIQTLQDNQDVVKAFSYINVNWSIQPMWIINPTFQKVDSRIQVSEYITKRWLEEINKERYIKAYEDLWEMLEGK